VSYNEQNTIITYSIVTKFVGDCLVGPHVLSHRLRATTTAISSYMTCQSCWEMYHWQSQRECGTRVVVLLARCSRAARDVLNNSYYDRWIGRKGPTVWPPHSPDLNLLDYYLLGHLNIFVGAAPRVTEEAFRHFIVNECQTVLNYPGIFERMWSLERLIEACIVSHGGHLSTYYKYTCHRRGISPFHCE
jgi:hypothetical protein